MRTRNWIVVIGIGLTASMALESAAPKGQATSSAAQQAAQAASPSIADAQARLQAKDPAGAVKLLEVITTREPKNPQAFRLLGIAHQQNNSPDAAIAAYKMALELQPTHPLPLYNLGTIYALKGDANEAFAWLNRAKATYRMDMSQALTDPGLASLRDDQRLAALVPKPEDFKDPFVEPVQILREWVGEAANDQFGWIARNIGDVDADGVPDVVTSAPTKAIGGAGAGRVYVYSTKSGARLWSADGRPGDQFGTGVEGAGDTNKDGIPDVIAAAPGGGYAKVYSGRDGRVLLTLDAEDKANDQFGQHAAGAGDVNGDGYADVIVGAPGNNAGGAGAGRAYVFSGRDGSKLLTLTGERAGDAFGSAVAGSTEGKTTLIMVGAPSAGEAKHGRTYVYGGLSTTPKFVIESDETGNSLGGMFLALPGDVDADGTPDVYASDWSNTAKGPSTGRVYVHSGKDGRRLFAFTGETAGEGFGTSPSNAGDVDADGHADFIVGAWQYAGAAPSGGRAYLYSGKDGRLMKTFTCRVAGDTFAFDAVTMGDIDGDGTTDFLITSAWSQIKGFQSGRVFIISSGVVGGVRS